MKKVLWTFATLVGLYLMARAVAWPFSVDPSDPTTYQNDWGGPTLAGAVAVHCGPGIVAAAILIGVIIRGRLTARR